MDTIIPAHCAQKQMPPELASLWSSVVKNIERLMHHNITTANMYIHTRLHKGNHPISITHYNDLLDRRSSGWARDEVKYF